MEVLLVERARRHGLLRLAATSSPCSPQSAAILKPSTLLTTPSPSSATTRAKLCRCRLTARCAVRTAESTTPSLARSLSVGSVRITSAPCQKTCRPSTLKNSAGRRSSSPLAAISSPRRTSRTRVRASRPLRSANVEVSPCRRRLSNGH